ncbi:MAG TPA: phosphoribosylformylglycinamidine cyclo-ligase [Bacteroidetes bacterium]|nr:phosphoribosylformylglycinamidine cyclo-ligase [Bacteroidota bacterium]
MGKKQLTYKDAGVDISAGEESVNRIKNLLNSTFDKNVLQGIGHFGAMYKIPVSNYRNPVLISSVDGVGTKLKVAVMMDKHDTIGEDLVNHCINDILTGGAKPMYFMDYLSLGKVNPSVVEQIVRGMVRGCRQTKCALIGGETAEMADIYQPGEYDLAGTIVGIVEQDKIINGERIQAGDVLIGLPSVGLHTNGYTLARKVFFDYAGFSPDHYDAGLRNSIGNELLKVHRNYFNVVQPALEKFDIHGLSHITGGGIEGNTRRILPPDLKLAIEWDAWEWLTIFKLIRELGNVPIEDMRRTFNLGIGFIIILSPEDVQAVQEELRNGGETSYIIGRVVSD